LIENFGDSDKQRYALIEQILYLKQRTLGKAAYYTIEFRRLATRIGWNDKIFIDLIRRGLLEEVQKEFGKAETPKSLFDATNLIITLDKKCFLDSNLKAKSKNPKETIINKRKYPEQRWNNSKYKNNYKKNKSDNVLSANYTPNKTNSMTCNFIISVDEKKHKIRLLIDSGSAKSFICQNYVKANKIPYSGLPSPINIQLPNEKSMNIKNVTKSLKLSVKISDPNLF